MCRRTLSYDGTHEADFFSGNLGVEQLSFSGKDHPRTFTSIKKVIKHNHGLIPQSTGLLKSSFLNNPGKIKKKLFHLLICEERK